MSQRGIQKLFIFCSLLKGFYDLLFLNLCRWLMWIKYNLWDTLLEIISNRQKWVHLKKFIGTWQKTIESWTRKCHHALIFCHNLFIMNCLLVVVASVLVRALPSHRCLKINYSDFIAWYKVLLLLAFGGMLSLQRMRLE